MPRDFTQADHLPKVGGGDGADPNDLPRQRRGTTPQMHGRYPDYDVLEQAESWDELTRKAVLDRVENVPPFRFFTPPQVETLSAFCDVVLDQTAEPRIPVLSFVDDKLYRSRLDGYRYAEMPDDRDTWRRVAAGLDEAARTGGAESYAAASSELQLAVADDFADGKLADGTWEQLNVKRAFSVVMRSVLAAFYAHPWAWNEIGFGGPAYPRGYARLGIGLSEAWEGREAVDNDPGTEIRDQRRG
jgi:hypothetical protein